MVGIRYTLRTLMSCTAAGWAQKQSCVVKCEYKTKDAIAHVDLSIPLRKTKRYSILRTATVRAPQNIFLQAYSRKAISCTCDGAGRLSSLD